MVDECPMTEECPGFDRGRRVCLLRPDDCEFAPPDTGAVAPAVGTLGTAEPQAPESVTSR